MSVEDVKSIVKGAGTNVVKVSILTAENKKKFKQSLRINPVGNLCIGSYSSNFPNYVIGDFVTSKWESVTIIK